ncbi:MAG: carbohydrate ABC transporter permease [Candidatus Caccosoma sp.]|nr:carbohydrate ABC transporter permease [Candidatus Caccosoma sp.]
MRNTKFNAIVYTLVIICTILSLTPSLFGLMLAFQKEVNIPHMFEGFNTFFKGITIENFIKVKDRSPYLFTWLKNSFIVSFSQTFIYILIASLAAFAFTRLKFKGQKILFNLCLVSMVIPGIINIVPNFIIISKLGLYNSLLAMILPGLSGVGGVFLLRQFMMDIPFDYDEAARIDGASDLTVYARVIMPMCKPVLISLILFTFQGAWNDFLWPLIVTEGDSSRTIASGLYLTIMSDTSMKGILMACAFISALPIIVIFIFGQKYFVEGNSGGIKG